jgi:hypothetical protein
MYELPKHQSENKKKNTKVKKTGNKKKLFHRITATNKHLIISSIFYAVCQFFLYRLCTVSIWAVGCPSSTIFFLLYYISLFEHPGSVWGGGGAVGKREFGNNKEINGKFLSSRFGPWT